MGTTAAEVKKAPVVTVRNVKVLERASEETLCFEATVYVDGRKFAYATNDGRGGDNKLHDEYLTMLVAEAENES